MKRNKKMLVYALGTGLLLGSGNIPAINVLAEKPTSMESVLANMSPQQLENYKQLQSVEKQGLYLDRTVNLKSDSPVKVIVQLDHHPEKVAQLQAKLEGKNFDAREAKAHVEKDQKHFKNELANMFKDKSNNGYKVGQTYKNAMNGVSLELPANRIEELMKLDVVRAVYSNVEVQIDPPVPSEAPSNGPAKDYMMESLPYLGVDKLHNEGFTGKGIKVGVLDTGIDYNHPDLDEVYKGGYDFVDNDNDPMEATYQDWQESGLPEFSNGNSYYTEHGTHVAGTVAGEGDNESEYSIKGVAPEADLYGYRVLGPYGRGSSEGVIAGIDRAVADGMDVINLSLGAGVNDPLYPTSVAVNNAVLSGVTAVVSAGNSGSESFTLGSPGTAALALTVGASDVPIDIATFTGQYGAESVNLQLMARNYSDNLADLEDSSMQLVDVGLATSNNDFIGKPVAGNIALISRGDISFVDKIKAAAAHGAKAVMIYNNNGEEGHIPHFLGEGVDFIPTFSLTKAEGEALKESIQEGETFSFSDRQAITTEGDRLADFSSRGPSRMNYDIKPEIVAPGVGVLSTVPSYINDKENGTYDYAYARLSGTSMASPHVAGMAALLLQSNQDLEPADVKSIFMNTADPMNGDYSVYEVGAGRVDPYEAIHSDMNFQVIDETTTLMNGEEMNIDEKTGGMSFGFQYIEKSLRDQRTILIENSSEETKTFNGSVEFTNQSHDASKNGIHLSFDEKIKVKAGKKKKTNVFLNIPKKAEEGYYEGYIRYVNEENPSEEYQIPFGIRISEEGIESVRAFNFSTKENNQFGALFNYTPMDFTLKSPMEQINVVLVDGKTNKEMGLVGVMDASGINEGQRIIINSAFAGYYYPYDDNRISVNPALAPEGHYKLRLVGTNSEGKTFTKETDTFIDNTAPEFSSTLPTGVYEYKEGQETVPFSMSLFDKTIEDMKKAGLEASQSNNYIVYHYGSPFPTGALNTDGEGNLSDEILMNPILSRYPVGFFAHDSVGNFAQGGPIVNSFVKEGTQYATASMDKKEIMAGDKLTMTLSSHNVKQLKEGSFSVDYDSNQLELTDVKIHPDFLEYGDSEITYDDKGKSSSTRHLDVQVNLENPEAEVNGDIPLAEVTFEAKDAKFYRMNYVTAPTFSSKYTDVNGQTTNLKGYFEGQYPELLRSYSEIRGDIKAQGFFGTDGKYDNGTDYSNAPVSIKVTDWEGNVHDGEMVRNNDFVAKLPVTDKPFQIEVNIPGHFPVKSTFTIYDQREDKVVGTWHGLPLRTQDAGDINQDSVIDIMDAIEMKNSWGTDEQHSDLNFDGTVDAKDFELVEYNFLEADPGVDSAPKPVEKYKGKSLDDIKNELGIE
ncbi:S8 family serine peptidase [Rossellomorea sp. y25]|uniref:S8 family serine peptidase n=1 Tax=Rossellomorea sp. y25 TaxID=3118174 RepID=UPI0030E4BC7A